jgi:hypothetical protein
MNIHIAVAIIAYLIILVLAYGAIIMNKRDYEKSEELIVLAFNNAFSILAFGVLVIYGLFMLPHITLDYQTTSYLILASKFLSVCTLGGSLYILNRKWNKLQ